MAMADSAVDRESLPAVVACPSDEDAEGVEAVLELFPPLLGQLGCRMVLLRVLFVLASESEMLIPLPEVRMELDPPKLERGAGISFVVIFMASPVVDILLLFFKSKSPINMVVVAKDPPPAPEIPGPPPDSTTTRNS